MHVHTNEVVISQCNSIANDVCDVCDVCEGICNRMILNFSYYCKYGILVLVMTGQALLMSPKGQNASRDGLDKLWEGGFLSLAILLHCEITTSFV